MVGLLSWVAVKLELALALAVVWTSSQLRWQHRTDGTWVVFPQLLSLDVADIWTVVLRWSLLWHGTISSLRYSCSETACDFVRTNAFDILVHVWNFAIVRLLSEVFEDGHISVLR